MIENSILFYPIAIFLILSAFFAIKFKNIFYSLLSAILVFFLAGFIFYILGSEYNAIIQIAVYGVAVPIILGLAIMFTNSNAKIKKTNTTLFLILIFVGILFLLTFLTAISSYDFPDLRPLTTSTYSTLLAFGYGIFNKYFYAFEIISIILTIAIVGLTITKKEYKGDEICKK